MFSQLLLGCFFTVEDWDDWTGENEGQLFHVMLCPYRSFIIFEVERALLGTAIFRSATNCDG